MRLHCLWIGLLVCLCIARGAIAEEAHLPALQRGINVAGWLANAMRQPLYARDFAQLKKAGFDHVRLPVNPEAFGFLLDASSQGVADAGFAPVDKAIVLAVDNGLAVVLDMHPRHGFMETLENMPQAEQRFVALWSALARRYAHYPPHILAFGLLNEPQYYHAETRYNALVQSLVTAIRQEDSHRLIIIAAPHGSSLEGLSFVTPVQDAAVMYDFHFYEPYMITHQGVHQGFAKKMLRYFHDVPYPAGQVTKDITFYAEDAPDMAKARRELVEYTQAGWNAERIAARIKLAKEWADNHRVKVICGEFGVLRTHGDPQSRYRWIADVRVALERQHIGWELWDYTDLFGITRLVGETRIDPVDKSVRLSNPEEGNRVLEPEALAALGLK